MWSAWPCSGPWFLGLAELLEEALGRPGELVMVESLSAIPGPKILAEARDVVRAC